MKTIKVSREVMHQLARNALGTGERGMPDGKRLDLLAAAQKIADATAEPGKPVLVEA